jgi:hypothetical protein
LNVILNLVIFVVFGHYYPVETTFAFGVIAVDCVNDRLKELIEAKVKRTAQLERFLDAITRR